MTQHFFRGTAMALTLALAGTAMKDHTPRLFAATSATLAAPAPVRLTERDVAASNQKVAAAYQDLVRTWSNVFQHLGADFDAPRLARYRGSVYTRCGPMPEDNAVYCPTTNTIYFDEVFVAGQAKEAAADLGTDGDMVSVGIIAHEMGHAVAAQLGFEARYPYENEKVADCLAGAFTRQADRDGSLEKGDVEEAFYGMAAAGDPAPESTGNARLDRRIALRAELMGHGTREQRTANFNAGLQQGPAACLPELRGIR